MNVNTYYLEFTSILLNFFAVEIDEQNHEGKELIFEKKDKRHQKKSLVVNLLELIQVMKKRAMIKTMGLIKYKYLSVNLKRKKIKEKENILKGKDNTIIGQQDEFKKIKTLINKSKCISCQKFFYQITKKTHTHTLKNKTEKKLGTTYCLGCKYITHNFRPQEVKMTNKALREESNCVVCWSSKSRFLKQKHYNKK